MFKEIILMSSHTMSPQNDENKYQKINSILSKYPLCKHCFRRILREVINHQSLEQSEETFRTHVSNFDSVSYDQCWLCGGLISEINDFVTLIKNRCLDFEFSTFLIGSRVDEEILEKEQKLHAMFGNENIGSIKNDINRNIGKILEDEWQKEVDFLAPDIMIIIDTIFNHVSLQIKSLYIYGRYNKFQRGIPQTKWFCRSCRGKGCRHCHYSGKLYDDSVEELIADPTQKMTQASKIIFHGCGREDIDVRMLGRGRPFIVEIQNPRIRTIDLTTLAEEINKNGGDMLLVNSLRFAEKDEIAFLKNAKFPKVYTVKVEVGKPFSKEKLKKALETLRGATIQQYTPTRVARRRAQKIRKRHIYSCELKSIKGTQATIVLEAESGTYIKELVTGDDGKTVPNVSMLVETPCTVSALDVIEIKGELNNGKTIEGTEK
jgi:tRNA pseudouridine synthase 10